MADDNLSATTSVTFGSRIKAIKSRDDLPTRWHDSPIEEFIGAHNWEKPIERTSATTPSLLLVSCIEFRFQPDIPPYFAYVIRSAGGRLSHMAGSEFALSYILAKGVRHVAIVGHNDCGMTKVYQFKPQLVQALVDQGWEPERAQRFIDDNADNFAISDEIDSLEKEYLRLKESFKNIEIAPLFVSLSTKRLHLPLWLNKYC